MNHPHRGRVKIFFPEYGKEYGFVIQLVEKNGEWIDAQPLKEWFFTLASGRSVNKLKNDGIPDWDKYGKPPREPKEKDIIVFELGLGRDKPKATPWGFAEEYDELVKKINHAQDARMKT